METSWAPAQWVAFQVLVWLTAGVLLTGVLVNFFDHDFGAAVWWAFCVALPVGWLPHHHIVGLGKRRQQAMLRELPFLLDMTTLCVEAGLNLQGALQQAVRYGPEGPLRDELHQALNDMRAGRARIEALTLMAKRTGLEALSSLVAALAQADQTGASVGPVLRAQAGQRRSERFLRAEEQALKAPVKMLFPMVSCIFPCTFLIIGFPVVSNMLAGLS